MRAENVQVRRPGRPRKGREYDADALINAAIQCFAEHGFDRTTLRMVAVTGGVDVALISYRYGSKLGLWNAVVEAVADESLEMIRTWPATAAATDRKERLQILCRGMVELVSRRPLFSKIMTNEVTSGGSGERKTQILEKMARPVLAEMTAYLEGPNPPGDRTGDPDLSIILSMGLVGLAVSSRDFLEAITSGSLDDRHFSAEVERLMMRLLA